MLKHGTELLGQKYHEINRSRYNMAGGGASRQCIAGGYGNPPSPNTNIADTETWDGSSWTEVN